MKKTINRKNVLMMIDIIIITIGYLLSYLITLPNELWEQYWATYKSSLLMAAIVFSASYYFFGIYNQIWRYADEREYRLCAISTAIGGVLFIVLGELAGYNVPIRIQLSAPFIILFIFVLSRISYKLFADGESIQSKTPTAGNRKPPYKKDLLIIGAGSAGVMLLKEIRANPQLGYRMKGFVDDNPKKIGRVLNGHKIYGPIDHLESLIRTYEIDEVLIATPAATGAEKKRIVDIASGTRAKVKILPSVATSLTNISDSAENNLLIGKLRNIDVEDLLGRDVVKVKETDIKAYTEGKNVLITGGGGSIGSELCRQISLYRPKKIIILDNYENNAYEIEQELIQEYRIIPQVEIISVQDEQRVKQLFADERAQGDPIEVVFHAAAHKHVPLMEHNPEQAIRNNILGTYHVAKLCNEFEAERMILISTDKAVNPTNVMGATKRACELVIQAMNSASEKTIFSAVRFGNVLGSNGSVIPLFKKQIEKGGPVTVTHPDIIRYFMTIPEAVSLVLNAGGLAQGGEIFVLDMGEPVKILDLAKNLIRLAGLELGQDIEIEFTGLRPGEKLYEELLLEEEGLKTTTSEKIFIGKMAELEASSLLEAIPEINRKNLSKEESVAWLKKFVTTYKEEEHER